jgi:hypothetical protein
MREERFTQGPWVALPEEVGKSYIRVRGTALGGLYKIANVISPITDETAEYESQTTWANAHLIAAAPDLYRALGLALLHMHKLTSPMAKADYSEMRYALQKARGEIDG